MATVAPALPTRQSAAHKTDCGKCPLQKLPHFRGLNRGEINFLTTFKVGELAADAGATILMESTRSAHLYTVLSGWAFRYKNLADGRRQILNFALPGDLIGLQGSLLGDMQHSIEALTPMTLCMFERDRVSELYKKHSGLAYDITWIAAREERILDEHLLSIGRRSALERAAYLLAFLCVRARATGALAKEGDADIPITQHHVADTLGLSLVHTNKTLRKLIDKKLLRWRDRGCTVLDLDGLIDIAGWQPDMQDCRPYI